MEVEFWLSEPGVSTSGALIREQRALETGTGRTEEERRGEGEGERGGEKKRRGKRKKGIKTGEEGRGEGESKKGSDIGWHEGVE